MQNPPSRANNTRSTNLGYNVLQQQEQRSDSYDPSGLANGPANGNVEARAYDQQQPSSASSAHPPPKKTLPANGKKTKGRVKIKMEFIDNKLRRYTTFSKRKTGIMKKAYELSTLTGTQVMLLVASETGHVYTFATRKLQPMITSEAGKALIQTCLNSPDPPPGPGSSGLDQRMSATGFEETDLTYSVGDDCDKISDSKGNYSSSPSSPQSGGASPQLMRSDSPQLVTLTDIPSSANPQQQTVSSNAGFATILATGTGAGKNLLNPSEGTTASATSASPGSISVVQNAQQNLSLVSGNVVIPASQAILHAGGSNSSNSTNNGNNVQGTFMYHTAQGLVYAAPSNLADGVIINLGQEQNATAPQQYITIPVSLSLTPAQQQLLQVSPTTATDQPQSSGASPAKKAKK